MHRHYGSALFVGAIVFLTSESAGARMRAAVCGDGHFLIAHAVVFSPATDALVPIILAGGKVSVGSACAPVTAKLKPSRRGTGVQALWSSCEGLSSSVRLKAVITDSCHTISGTLTAQRMHLKVPFMATTPFKDIIIHGPASMSVPFQAMLDGNVTTDPAGNATGQVKVTYGAGGAATVVVGGGTLKVQVDGHTFDLSPSDPQSVTVDGVAEPVGGALAEFTSALQSGQDPSQWSATAQVTLALLALSSTDAWQQNVEGARRFSGSAVATRSVSRLGREADTSSDSFWCKAAAYVAGGAIAAVAAIGCGSISAACVGVDVYTIGGVTMPCVVAIGACGAAGFAGTMGAYDIVLSWWTGGQTPNPPPPSAPTASGAWVVDSKGAAVGAVVTAFANGQSADVVGRLAGHSLWFVVDANGFVDAANLTYGLFAYESTNCSGVPLEVVDTAGSPLVPGLFVHGVNGYYPSGPATSHTLHSSVAYYATDPTACVGGTVFSLPDRCCTTGLSGNGIAFALDSTLDISSLSLTPPFHIELR